MKHKHVVMMALGLLINSYSSLVNAHGIWVEERLDQKQIVLGEGPTDNAYKPSSVKFVNGYSESLHKVAVPVIDKGDHAVLNIDKDISMLGAYFDYGFWTKDKSGKVQNLPMNQVVGAEKGTHAVKYNVTYLGVVKALKAVPDIPLQIIPQINPITLHLGDELPVIVMKDGKPLANVDVIPDVVNNLTKTLKTDDQGKAILKVTNDGLNVIGVELAFPIEEKNPLATQTKYFSTLSFTLHPEEE